MEVIIRYAGMLCQCRYTLQDTTSSYAAIFLNIIHRCSHISSNSTDMLKTDSTENPEIRQIFCTLFWACAMETLLLITYSLQVHPFMRNFVQLIQVTVTEEECFVHC
jgi:hypothetical protein